MSAVTSNSQTVFAAGLLFVSVAETVDDTDGWLFQVACAVYQTDVMRLRLTVLEPDWL
jgi:hypothetical protein